MACPVCDDRATDGDLCVAHRVMAEAEVPAVLEKRTPPKQHDYISVASLHHGLDDPEPENRWWERGHATVEMLSLLALFVFILLLLQALEFQW